MAKSPGAHRRRGLKRWMSKSRLELEGTRQRVGYGYGYGAQNCCLCSHPCTQLRNFMFVLCGARLFHSGDNFERMVLTGTNAYVLQLKSSAVKSRAPRPLDDARHCRGLVHLDLRSCPNDKDTRDVERDQAAVEDGSSDCKVDLVTAGNGSDFGFDDAWRRPSAQRARRQPTISRSERANPRWAQGNAGIEDNGSVKSLSRAAATLSALVLLWLAGSFPALSGVPQTIAYAVLFFGLYWTISWRVGLTESENDGIDDEAASSFLDGGELLSAPARVALFCVPAAILSASLVATPNTVMSNLLPILPTLAENDAPAGRTELWVVAGIILALTFLDAIVSSKEAPTSGTSATTTEGNAQSHSQNEEDEESSDALWNVERKLIDRWDASFRGRQTSTPPPTSFLDKEETDDV